jgi:uncharacterized protein YunC (DUF1805 family)
MFGVPPHMFGFASLITGGMALGSLSFLNMAGGLFFATFLAVILSSGCIACGAVSVGDGIAKESKFAIALGVIGIAMILGLVIWALAQLVIHLMG